jgi:predicted RNase H-like nuclease
VVASIGEGGALDVAVVPDFARIVRQVRGGQFDHVVVDMPIGLPDTESRKADQEARRLLRARASCVSPAPRRPMLNAKSHDEANRIRERLDGKRISKQGYLLLPKIYEVDELIDSTSQRVIREGHPEVTFCVLNDDTPIAEPKETPEGRSIRVELLGRAFASLGVAFDELPTKPRGASTDDVIDALAMLVSAVRAARGQSRTLPARPEYDERGLRAEMVA